MRLLIPVVRFTTGGSADLIEMHYRSLQFPQPMECAVDHRIWDPQFPGFLIGLSSSGHHATLQPPQAPGFPVCEHGFVLWSPCATDAILSQAPRPPQTERGGLLH